MGKSGYGRVKCATDTREARCTMQDARRTLHVALYVLRGHRRDVHRWWRVNMAYGGQEQPWVGLDERYGQTRSAIRVPMDPIQRSALR